MITRRVHHAKFLCALSAFLLQANTPEAFASESLPPPAPAPNHAQRKPESQRYLVEGQATLTPDDIAAKNTLDSIANDAEGYTGAIFHTPYDVSVKPPLLKALISVEKNLSPYQLDADSAKEVTLKDVLDTALMRNLDIKISDQEMLTHKWNWVGSLGGFLPNLINDLNFEGLNGTYVSPAGAAIPIKNPFLTTDNGFDWYLFKGGGILFSALEQKHLYKASQFSLKGTTNETLLESARLYYKLVLNNALLQIRVKLVDVGKALVIVNQDLFDNGVNTELDVLQAKYQLSADRQELIKQQIERRQSAVNLATALNINPELDLTLKHHIVEKKRLIDKSLTASDLLNIAIDNRPELKHFEQMRLAAKDAVNVAASTLFPTVQAMGNIIGTGSRVGSSLSTGSETPLSSSGSGISAITSASGLPLEGGSGGKRWTSHALYQIGVDVNWQLGGMAVSEVAQVQSAKAQARKAQLDFNRNLFRIYEDVRNAYLASIKAENLIEETTDAVNFATEGLRVAVVRLRDGVGTYLDVINAERFYTAALINKANAIVDYNIAQAKILKEIGLISSDTLTADTPLKRPPPPATSGKKHH